MAAAATVAPVALRTIGAGVVAAAAAVTAGAAFRPASARQMGLDHFGHFFRGGGAAANENDEESEFRSSKEDTDARSTSSGRLDRHGSPDFDWAIVFKLSEEAIREASWRLRTGPEQIEFVDDILDNSIRSSTFPRHLLELIIFESWLEFRTAVLNAVLDLLTLPDVGLTCQLFRSIGGGRDAAQASLLVLVRLPERSARSWASTLDYELPLDPETWRCVGLPAPAEGKQDYPPGFARYDEQLLAHYEDVHQEPLYKVRSREGSFFQMKDRIRLLTQAVEEHLDIQSLICKGVISAQFPLHSSVELQRLASSWARPYMVWTWVQPLEHIHSYFGEQIAFYFAWLGFQAKLLSFLAVAGGAVEAWASLHYGWTALLHSVCGSAVVLWANVYLRLWRRREEALHFEWGADIDVNKCKTQENPNYVGDWVLDPVTGGQRKRYPKRKLLVCRFASHLVTILFIALSVTVVVAIFVLRNFLESEDGTPDSGIFSNDVLRVQVVISTLNTLQIISLEYIWLLIAPSLVELENHRTQEGRRNALIWKMFLFRAINAFGASSWIAFVKTSDQCSNQDCVAELRLQLASVFFAYQGVTIWSDILYPWLKYRILMYYEDSALAKEQGLVLRQLSYIEQQAKMDEYEWQSAVQDYMSVILQTGLVLLYFSVLPSLALLALGSHLLQLRADAWKLCCTHRRPFPAEVSGVGAWNEVMEFLIWLAVVVNASLVIFTTGLLSERTEAERWLLLVLAERAAMFLGQQIEALMPPRTKHINIARQRHSFMMEKLQQERIGCKMCSGEAERGHESIDDCFDEHPGSSSANAGHGKTEMQRLARPLPSGGFDPASLPRHLMDHLVAKHLRRDPKRRPYERRRRQHRNASKSSEFVSEGGRSTLEGDEEDQRDGPRNGDRNERRVVRPSCCSWCCCWPGASQAEHRANPGDRSAAGGMPTSAAGTAAAGAAAASSASAAGGGGASASGARGSALGPSSSMKRLPASMGRRKPGFSNLFGGDTYTPSSWGNVGSRKRTLPEDAYFTVDN